MSTFGLIGLLVAFAGVVVSVVCLVAGALVSRAGRSDTGDTLTWGGHVASLLSFAGLTVCCGVLVYCFMTGDMTIEYVLNQHSDASGDMAWLYKLSGLWAGRQGSLLFWAWLIAAFNSLVAVRNLKRTAKLDSMALLVAQLVLAAFVGVMLFSENNMPFTVTPAISLPSTLGVKVSSSSVSAITSAEYLPSRLAIVWLSPSMLSSTVFGKVTVSMCSDGSSSRSPTRSNRMESKLKLPELSEPSERILMV